MSDTKDDKTEQKKQQKNAKLILAVNDEYGTRHYIFGDRFASQALLDVIDVANNAEVDQAKKGDKLQ